MNVLVFLLLFNSAYTGSMPLTCKALLALLEQAIYAPNVYYIIYKFHDVVITCIVYVIIVCSKKSILCFYGSHRY